MRPCFGLKPARMLAFGVHFTLFTSFTLFTLFTSFTPRVQTGRGLYDRPARPVADAERAPPRQGYRSVRRDQDRRRPGFAAVIGTAFPTRGVRPHARVFTSGRENR